MSKSGMLTSAVVAARLVLRVLGLGVLTRARLFGELVLTLWGPGLSLGIVLEFHESGTVYSICPPLPCVMACLAL